MVQFPSTQSRNFVCPFPPSPVNLSYSLTIPRSRVVLYRGFVYSPLSTSRNHPNRVHTPSPSRHINTTPPLNSSPSFKIFKPSNNNKNTHNLDKNSPKRYMNIFEDDLSTFCSSFFHDSLSPLPEMQNVQQILTPVRKRERQDDSEPASKKSRSSDSEEDDSTTTPLSASPTTGPGPSQRRLWVKTRSRDWWDRVSHPSYPDPDFRRDFKMSKATFDLVCKSLGSAIAKEDTPLRVAIPVRQRVAVCLWRLATGEPLRLVSKRFGLGISTCHKLILEVCSAIRNVLMSKFLNWPDAENSAEISRKFEAAYGIPNMLGAIYTTHVPIIAPKVNVADYFNRRHTERNQKTSYSVTVQGVVDPNGVFTDICIGWPGSLPDDKVLEKSVLSQRGGKGALNGSWIVGGGSFPLTDWMLVPYTNQNLTWTQHAFNEKVGEVREIARKAFERMKRRWGCLQKRTEMKLDDLPVVLGACCVLHNICELRNEEVELSDGPGFQLFDDEMVAENGIWSIGAMEMRDRIAHNLLHSGRAGNFFSRGFSCSMMRWWRRMGFGR